MAKKNKKEMEPQYYVSATNLPTYNYKVYHMKTSEKVLYFLIAFVVGAAVGYLFYGGLAKDEYGNATTATYVLNISIMVIVGCIAGKIFVPSRRDTIILKSIGATIPPEPITLPTLWVPLCGQRALLPRRLRHSAYTPRSKATCLLPATWATECR